MGRTPETTPSRGTGVKEPPPTVSGQWLLAALAVTLAGAAVCGYCALCLLFYQGQWQMLFHPSRTISTTPGSVGIAFEDIRFDVTDAGLPQLDGWWMPAAPQSRYSADTILYLHGASGSLSDAVPALAELHSLGINIFAIDYRGFGRSGGRHPTERLGIDDSIAAWTWLTDTRHLPAQSIVVYGNGVGATFAAALVTRFAPAGVILEDPNLPARQTFAADPRARMVPLFLLRNETLDPATDLRSAHLPRLFLDRRGDTDRTRDVFHASSYPKDYTDLRGAPEITVRATLRRFLDEVLR
jgi:hypothetical protein